MNIQVLYETDFNVWIQENIAFLKQSRCNEIDTDHLIVELEDMAKKTRVNKSLYCLNYLIIRRFLSYKLIA